MKKSEIREIHSEKLSILDLQITGNVVIISRSKMVESADLIDKPD